MVNYGTTFTGTSATLTGATPSTSVETTRVTGDAMARLNVNADGGISWGNGVGGTDTNLYRAAGGILQTDSTFQPAILDTQSQPSSTGLYTGCVMSIASATTFNITAGTGYIYDYATSPSSPSVTKVSISAQTVTVPLAQGIYWWVANSAGVISNLTSQPTADQRRTLILLGITATSAGALVIAASIPQYTAQPLAQLYDLMYALGPFTVHNAMPAISPNGANLRFNLSSGGLFTPSANYDTDVNNPHVTTTVAETPAAFRYATRTAGSETTATLIDPTNYDVAGTVTLVPGGGATATNQAVFLSGSQIVGSQLITQYGQATFASLAAAVAAVSSGVFVVNPDVVASAFIGFISVTKQCTSLADTANCTITPAGQFQVA